MFTTEYTIDNLTDKSVSVKRQQYYDEIMLGQLHRKSYDNSKKGRIELKDEIPSAQYNAVMAVWGDEPTVFDKD